MVRSEKEYIKAQKKMLLYVQSIHDLQDIDTYSMGEEETEILMNCIKSGYLVGRYEENGVEFRTMDGKAHPELLSTQITPLGAAFLKPKHTDLKATLALIISVLALIVAILSDFPAIAETIRSLGCWLGLIAPKQ